MNHFGICDLHGHFLPGMDDGSKSVEESLRMMKASKEQGVHSMFATPHYYPVELVEQFLDRRARSACALQAALAEKREAYPRFCLGAEVAYRPGIGTAEDLEMLCLGRSRYLLLELPFTPWDGSLFRDLSSLTNVRGLIPVIAHIERYMHLQSQKVMDRLLEQNVLLQMNAEVFLNWRSRGAAKRLFQSGVVQLLGTDCHNMQTRSPNLGAALSYLEKKGMGKIIRQIAELSNDIFEEAISGQ